MKRLQLILVWAAATAAIVLSSSTTHFAQRSKTSSTTDNVLQLGDTTSAGDWHTQRAPFSVDCSGHLSTWTLSFMGLRVDVTVRQTH